MPRSSWTPPSVSTQTLIAALDVMRRESIAKVDAEIDHHLKQSERGYRLHRGHIASLQRQRARMTASLGR